MLHNFCLRFASVRTHPCPPRASFGAVSFPVGKLWGFRGAVIAHAGVLVMVFSSPRSLSRGEDPSPFPLSQHVSLFRIMASLAGLGSPEICSWEMQFSILGLTHAISNKVTYWMLGSSSSIKRHWSMRHETQLCQFKAPPILQPCVRTLCILSKFSVAEMHPQPLSVCPDPSIVLLNVKS